MHLDDTSTDSVKKEHSHIRADASRVWVDGTAEECAECKRAPKATCRTDAVDAAQARAQERLQTIYQPTNEDTRAKQLGTASAAPSTRTDAAPSSPTTGGDKVADAAARFRARMSSQYQQTGGCT